MADRDAIVDVEQSPDESPTDQLKFQDFSDDHSLLQDHAEDELLGKQRHSFDEYGSEEEDNTELLSGQKKQPSFWTFEYYQQFFDVDTSQVLWRLFGSFTPRPGQNYLQTQIRPTPDLYGPFWVCATLVFTIAISGDLTDFIENKDDPNYKWHAHFASVTVGGIAIFCYAWLIPALLYGTLHYRGNIAGYTFLELACLYGYSLAVFIPISLLCTIDYQPVQWILIMLGLALSGAVLILSLWPAVRDDDQKIAFIIIGLVFVFHAALAVGFKLYFFPHYDHHPSSTAQPHTVVTTPVKIVTNNRTFVG